ncbi:MAG: hypothetical protein O2854_07375, partial [Chloroflexi bacterium]|nr:hypothetical protein [Chloroflexota bacterium]
MYTQTDRKTIGKPGLVRLLADADPSLYAHTAYLTPSALNQPRPTKPVRPEPKACPEQSRREGREDV